MVTQSSLRRALIVDDEIAARESLHLLMEAHPEIEIVGEAANVTEALALFREFHPDLIFLDVRMPKRDGFALLPELRPVPEIIFVTAYDCFAVKAFEVNAIDYLVKPIHEDRLALALMRLSSPEDAVANNTKVPSKPFAQDDRIFLYSDQQIRVVMPGEITHIEADGNYSRVHVAGTDSLFIRRTMAQWTALLPRELFLRVDRSVLINREAVRGVKTLPEQETHVVLEGAREPLKLGKMASSRLRKALLQMQPS